MSSKPKFATSKSNKFEKNVEKRKKKGNSKYCMKIGHWIKDYPKLKLKEEKKGHMHVYLE